MNHLHSSSSRVIYVCHPFSGNVGKNQADVAHITRHLSVQGHLPLAPQLYIPNFIDESTERDYAMKICFGLVALADEVWTYGELTEGMRLEITEAWRLGIPVVAGDASAEITLTGEPPPMRTRGRR